MKEKIPTEVKKLYHKNNLKTKLYIILRWRLCPFEKIESLLPKFGTIVDIGCGYGLLTNFLALKSDKRSVIGIDNSFKRIKIAQTTVDKRSNIEFTLTDLRKFKLPKCQAVVMSDLLHHLSEEAIFNLLKRIYNQLNAGGLLIIEEVNNKPFWKYLSNIFIDHLLYPKQKIRFKTINQWEKILREIGFIFQVFEAHQGLPLADTIFICTKK